MPDTLALLHTPLGQPGSGRVRYGAAMEYYRRGEISAEALEVYRVASAHDHRDPLPMLKDLHLPLPPMPAAESPVRVLYHALRDYLLTLDHPGFAEVAMGLPADPGAEQAMTHRGNAVVEAWLAPALALVSETRPKLAAAIKSAADRLEWVTYDAYPRDEIGAAFAEGHAFASIRGGEAPFAAEDYDMGLFLIRPDTLYRDHRHAAPELYAPLTGPHGWRFGAGDALQIKPAHEPVWNPAHQPHLTKVGKVPFLSLFVWTKDVNEAAVVIPATDWAQLEGAAIG